MGEAEQQGFAEDDKDESEEDPKFLGGWLESSNTSGLIS